jgi:hypothetical protein
LFFPCSEDFEDNSEDLLQINMYVFVGTGGDEYTFTKRIWIPHTFKFGSVDGTTGHNQHDVYFFLMCYDTYGSLITKNIAYYQCFSELQYKDP